MGQVKSQDKLLKVRKINFQLFEELVHTTPQETVLREQNRARGSLRISSREHKTWQSPGARNQERKGGDQHG